MLELLIYFFLFFLGLSVGSFLNVVIFRFGFSESKKSRSRCMACNAKLAPRDLVPVLSYIMLRGRCRGCGSRFSLQYPLLEITVGALFVLAYAVFPPLPPLAGYTAFISLLVFLSGLVALTVYDIRHTIVPMQFVYVIVGAAVVASIAQSIFFNSFAPFLDSVLGGIVLALFFAAMYVVTRGRGMGLGDAYVAGAAGIMLGLTRGIEATMLAFWIGTIVCLPVYLLNTLPQGQRLPRFLRVTMKTELPFVPFLALGVVLALFTPLSPLSVGTWIAKVLWFKII